MTSMSERVTALAGAGYSVPSKTVGPASRRGRFADAPDEEGELEEAGAAAGRFIVDCFFGAEAGASAVRYTVDSFGAMGTALAGAGSGVPSQTVGPPLRRGRFADAPDEEGELEEASASAVRFIVDSFGAMAGKLDGMERKTLNER
jgi:hypothetical protein